MGDENSITNNAAPIYSPFVFLDGIFRFARASYQYKSTLENQVTRHYPNGIENPTLRHCYWNSLLQALASLPDFLSLLELLSRISSCSAYAAISANPTHAHHPNDTKIFAFAQSLNWALNFINLNIPTSQNRVLFKTGALFDENALYTFHRANSEARPHHFSMPLVKSPGTNLNLNVLSSILNSLQQEDPHEVLLHVMNALAEAIQLGCESLDLSESSSLVAANGDILGHASNRNNCHIPNSVDTANKNLDSQSNEAKSFINTETMFHNASGSTSAETGCNNSLIDEVEKCSVSEANLSSEASAKSFLFIDNDKTNEISDASVKASWKNASKTISNCIYGTILEWMQCTRCGMNTMNPPVSFSSLELPVHLESNVLHDDKSMFLDDCLKAAFSPEPIFNVFCSRCTCVETFNQLEARRKKLIDLYETACYSFNLASKPTVDSTSDYDNRLESASTSVTKPSVSSNIRFINRFSFFNLQLTKIEIQMSMVKSCLKLLEKQNSLFNGGASRLGNKLVTSSFCKYCETSKIIENGFKCCGLPTNWIRVTKIKYSKIIEFPLILCLHLQRNYFHEGMLRKTERHVHFPQLLSLTALKSCLSASPQSLKSIFQKTNDQKLDLSNSQYEYSITNAELNERDGIMGDVNAVPAEPVPRKAKEFSESFDFSFESLYTLHAVVQHVGAATSGHFVCFRRWDCDIFFPPPFLLTLLWAFHPFFWNEVLVKCSSTIPIHNDHHSTYSLGKILKAIQQHRFVCVSDTFVQSVSTETVLDSQAYLLFYQKVDPPILTALR